MERLPQDLVVQHVGSADLGLGRRPAGLALPRRSSSPRRSRSSSAPTAGCASTSTRGPRPGVALLLLTFVFGSDVNGQRLTLSFGPVSGQPSELLKVILVVFLAGYLSENRPLLVEESTQVGPISTAAAAVPRADGRDVGDRPRHRRRPARPRRGAPVLRGVPVAALRGDRPARLRRGSGSSCSSSGAFFMYQLFPHVQTRVDIWIDPFVSPAGDGLPDHPGALRLRAGRAPRDRARGRAADDRTGSRAGSPPSTRTSRSRRWARSWA